MWRKAFSISAGSLAVLLGALDTYVVVTVIVDIMRDVGIPINKLQRATPIVTSYLLGYIAAMPLLGRASDRFGRKLILQLSLIGFTAGSVVTAMSHDVPTVIVGRVIQGVASGALLPVTLALAADLFAHRRRAAVLGGIGAAQELGSVIGPLYGLAMVSIFTTWRSVFWLNVPLALLCVVIIQFSMPPRKAETRRGEAGERAKVDVVGGVLLALTLSLTVIGIYNPSPDGKVIFPSWGVPTLIGAAVALVAFVLWEWKAKTRLLEPAGVRFVPLFAALLASLMAGAALMVTLVNVELYGQAVLRLDRSDSAVLLLKFLVALPIGAVLGGFVATRIGDRIVACFGLLVSAGGYWLVSDWPIHALHAQHHWLGVSLPVIGTDLAIAGFGLGLVIGPLTSAALRAIPERQHGIGSSLVVVARMVGMLVGVGALTAWGLYRFNQIVDAMPSPVLKDTGNAAQNLSAMVRAIGDQSVQAYSEQYNEIFAITAVICLVGALGAVFIGSHRSTPAD